MRIFPEISTIAIAFRISGVAGYRDGRQIWKIDHCDANKSLPFVSGE